MKKFLIALIALILATRSQAQSLADSMKKYFNYDTLRHVSCAQTPPGIYALTFKIDNKKHVYDVGFSSDSLSILKSLFILALQRCLKAAKTYKTDKRYLQFVYYNNFLGCITNVDSGIVTNINKEAVAFLGQQIYAIEQTFGNSVNNDEEFIVLKPAVIDNFDPNKIQKKRFLNDNKPLSENVSKEKMDKLIEEVEKRRAEKKAKDSNQ